MRVLIGCECSGIVAGAFRSLGHESYSCDLKPCEGEPRYHIEGDIITTITDRGPWDFIGLHPVCTRLAVSGNHKYAEGKPGWADRLESVDWTVGLYRLAKGHSTCGYLENPRGVLTTLGGMPRAQEVQPHDYGHDASKLTCLWTWGVPPLRPTKRVAPRGVCGCGYTMPPRDYAIRGRLGCPKCNGDYPVRPRWANQTDNGQNRLGPSDTRQADRSRTYSGIAAAMADQWGREVLGT